MQEFLKEAVVILPYHKDKVLLQLRDNKPDIVYPNSWGFFGGTIETGEYPMQSAKRELYEEIGYESDEMSYLSIDRMSAPYEIIQHSFYCPLKIQVEEINLHEGFDFGFFTLEEIRSKQLFSTKAKKKYPVIDHPYIEYLVRKLRQKIDRIDGNYLK